MDVTTIKFSADQARILAPVIDPWLAFYFRARYGHGHWFYRNQWEHNHELLL